MSDFGDFGGDDEGESSADTLGPTITIQPTTLAPIGSVGAPPIVSTMPTMVITAPAPTFNPTPIVPASTPVVGDTGGEEEAVAASQDATNENAQASANVASLAAGSSSFNVGAAAAPVANIVTQSVTFQPVADATPAVAATAAAVPPAAAAAAQQPAIAVAAVTPDPNATAGGATGTATAAQTSAAQQTTATVVTTDTNTAGGTTGAIAATGTATGTATTTGTGTGTGTNQPAATEPVAAAASGGATSNTISPTANSLGLSPVSFSSDGGASSINGNGALPQGANVITSQTFTLNPSDPTSQIIITLATNPADPNDLLFTTQTPASLDLTNEHILNSPWLPVSQIFGGLFFSAIAIGAKLPITPAFAAGQVTFGEIFANSQDLQNLVSFGLQMVALQESGVAYDPSLVPPFPVLGGFNDVNSLKGTLTTDGATLGNALGLKTAEYLNYPAPNSFAAWASLAGGVLGMYAANDLNSPNSQIVKFTLAAGQQDAAEAGVSTSFPGAASATQNQAPIPISLDPADVARSLATNTAVAVANPTISGMGLFFAAAVGAANDLINKNSQIIANALSKVPPTTVPEGGFPEPPPTGETATPAASPNQSSPEDTASAANAIANLNAGGFLSGVPDQTDQGLPNNSPNLIANANPPATVVAGVPGGTGTSSNDTVGTPDGNPVGTSPLPTTIPGSPGPVALTGGTSPLPITVQPVAASPFSTIAPAASIAEPVTPTFVDPATGAATGAGGVVAPAKTSTPASTIKAAAAASTAGGSNPLANTITAIANPNATPATVAVSTSVPVEQMAATQTVDPAAALAMFNASGQAATQQTGANGVVANTSPSTDTTTEDASGDTTNPITAANATPGAASAGDQATVAAASITSNLQQPASALNSLLPSPLIPAAPQPFAPPADASAAIANLIQEAIIPAMEHGAKDPNVQAVVENFEERQSPIVAGQDESDLMTAAGAIQNLIPQRPSVNQVLSHLGL